MYGANANESSNNHPQPDHDAIGVHVRMLHTLAQASGVDGVVTFTRIDAKRATVHTEQFAIGDAEAMTNAIIGWATVQHLNLYSPFVIFRKDLPLGAKGSESDVRAVLALVGDLDSDKGKTAIGLDDLPLEPPYAIETSAGNYQPFYPLAKTLTAEAAKPLAIALSDAIGGDPGTKDVSHIWRIPGTLNWPGATKLARGRSPIPQLVTVTTAWSGDLVEPVDIQEAVEDIVRTAPAASPVTRGPACGASGVGTVVETFDELPDAVAEKIVNRVPPGYRSEAMASVAWSLFKRGWDDDAIEEIVRAHPHGIGERYTQKGKNLRKDIARLRKKWDARPIEYESATRTDAEASKAPVDEAWDPWRETLAPRLDHALLPAVIREAAAASARVSGADVDAFAIGYLVGLTACGDARLRITPKQHARDWSVPLLLWVLLVAPPSSMKSEVIKAARALAASLDIQERERHRRDVATAEVGALLGGATMTRAAAKRARDEAARTVAPPRQRVCGDVTIEKLADILGANPGGCAVIREELSGWLGGLGRYTAKGTDAADRAFYCAMRDGSPHDRQRVSSPSVHIEHCAGSFLGAVQPERLLEMELPTADGLMQRFMPLIMREARGYEDSEDADDAKALLRPVRDRLAALVPTMQRDPFGQTVAVPYKLTAEGAELYKAFADDMRLAGRAQEPSREFGECLNKMGPMWLSLALLFHLIESGNEAPAALVPLAVARRVDTLIREFFIPHAWQFYDLLSGSSVQRVRSVATAILRCPKDEIVLRDMVHRCRALRGKERDVQIRMMQRFETFGWLTRLDRYGAAHPRWRRTAGLVERFEEEVKREEAARAAVTAAIKADASKATREQ